MGNTFGTSTTAAVGPTPSNTFADGKELKGRITNYSGRSITLRLSTGSRELSNGESIRVNLETTRVIVDGHTSSPLQDCFGKSSDKSLFPETFLARCLSEAERTNQTLGDYLLHRGRDNHYKVLEFMVPNADKQDYGSLSQFGISPCNDHCPKDCQTNRTPLMYHNKSSYTATIVCGHRLGNVFQLSPGCRTKYSDIYCRPQHDEALVNGRAEAYRLSTYVKGITGFTFKDNVYWKVRISNQTHDSITAECEEETIVVGPRSYRQCSAVKKIITMKGKTFPRPTDLVDGVKVKTIFHGYSFKICSVGGVTQIYVKASLGG